MYYFYLGSLTQGYFYSTVYKWLFELTVLFSFHKLSKLILNEAVYLFGIFINCEWAIDINDLIAIVSYVLIPENTKYKYNSLLTIFKYLYSIKWL